MHKRAYLYTLWISYDFFSFGFFLDLRYLTTKYVHNEQMHEAVTKWKTLLTKTDENIF